MTLATHELEHVMMSVGKAKAKAMRKFQLSVKCSRAAAKRILPVRQKGDQLPRRTHAFDANGSRRLAGRQGPIATPASHILVRRLVTLPEHPAGEYARLNGEVVFGVLQGRLEVGGRGRTSLTRPGP